MISIRSKSPPKTDATQLSNHLCRNCRDVIAYQPKGRLSAGSVRLSERCGRFEWCEFIKTKDTCGLCQRNYEAYLHVIDVSRKWPRPEYRVTDANLSYLSVEKGVAENGLQFLEFAVHVRHRADPGHEYQDRLENVLAITTLLNGKITMHFP